MIPPALVPIVLRACAAIVIAVALLATGYVAGCSAEQAEHLEQDRARANAEHQAITKRIIDNGVEVARQKAANEEITKGKDHEIAALTARLTAAGRLRVGASVCGGSAGAPAPAVPGGGDGADSPGGLVSHEADRDLKALIVDVETDLATGRACQAAAREHGLAY